MTAPSPTEPDTSTPIGSYRRAWLGYMRDARIRQHAASGGIVTGVFDYLLRTGQVDAALVCRTAVKPEGLDYELFLARNLDDLVSAQSSKYFDIPMIRGLDLIKAFEGRVAVVGLPSQISAFTRRAAKSEDLALKIAFKISVFCGHNSKVDLMHFVWRKKQIDPAQVRTFYFRQGHWRGEMVTLMHSGEEHRMPFQEFSTYQNLHILSLERCLNCFDHMGYYADISTGDIWSGHMQQEPVKHSIFLARTERGEAVVQEMLKQSLVEAQEVDRRQVYLSQKRSINYHYNLTARARWAKLFGMNIRDRVQSRVTWRDSLGALIVLLNHKISKNPRWLKWFMRLPRRVVWLYLMIFKALMHYERKDY